MAQSTEAQREGVAQVAGRILIACRMRENSLLKYELEQALYLTAEARPTSTLEMERMEALSGALESLRNNHWPPAGAIRLLEHLARAGSGSQPHALPKLRLQPGMPVAGRC